MTKRPTNLKIGVCRLSRNGDFNENDLMDLFDTWADQMDPLSSDLVHIL